MEYEKINVEYPLRKSIKWDDDYRKQWNREYRRKIKEGLIQPIKRGDEPSKWTDKLYRQAYDKARKEKLNKVKKEKKMNNEVDSRPNFTTDEKDIILKKMLEDVKNDKTPSHPWFKLGLVSINKRQYPKKTETK